MEFRPIFQSLKRNKFMAFLMILQIAFTMGVLSSSVLVTTETLSEWNLPSGMPHNDVVRITPRFYDETRDVRQALLADIERTKSIPGVIEVTASNAVPFTAENMINVYTSPEEEAQEFKSVVFEADHNIFNALQLSLIDGRQFSVEDMPDANNRDYVTSEVMMSEDMAKVMFPDASPIGQTVWLSKGADPVKVVGIYSNFMTGERLNGRGKSYQSFIRMKSTWTHGNEPHYLIRVEGGKGAKMLEDIVDVFYKEQGRYIQNSELLTRTQKRMYDGRGSRALILLVISTVLVFITAFGITGLTSFLVNQRRKQIGTRRALGARRSDIIRYFLTENAIITFVGLSIGLAVTLFITFEISEQAESNFLNLGVIGLTALAIWIINLVSVWFPAMRASKVAPAIVTRSA